MNRREMMELATTAALLSAAGVAAAAEQKAGSAVSDLIAATSRCSNVGEVCLSHCLTMLSMGDKTLAHCTWKVRDTIAVCDALRQLAASESAHTKAMAKLVSNVCSDCEAECKKHDKHPICVECAKACRDCKAACDKVAA